MVNYLLMGKWACSEVHSRVAEHGSYWSKFCCKELKTRKKNHKWLVGDNKYIINMVNLELITSTWVCRVRTYLIISSSIRALPVICHVIENVNIIIFLWKYNIPNLELDDNVKSLVIVVCAVRHALWDLKVKVSKMEVSRAFMAIKYIIVWHQVAINCVGILKIKKKKLWKKDNGFFLV